jgi:ribulose-5-phosphate 4-epimerase/fuculose-1-phosphate aldolase
MPAEDFQHLFSAGMDRALGFEKASLASVVRFNSYALDLYWNTLWHSSVFSELAEATRQALALSMQLQLGWLNLSLATVGSTCRQAQVAAEVLERSMDIALGVRAA